MAQTRATDESPPPSVRSSSAIGRVERGTVSHSPPAATGTPVSRKPA
jgi:hypothetical protein